MIAAEINGAEKRCKNGLAMMRIWMLSRFIYLFGMRNGVDYGTGMIGLLVHVYRFKYKVSFCPVNGL